MTTFVETGREIDSRDEDNSLPSRDEDDFSMKPISDPDGISGFRKTDRSWYLAPARYRVRVIARVVASHKIADILKFLQNVAYLGEY